MRRRQDLHLHGRACASAGSRTPRLVLSLQALEFDALRLGGRLELAQLNLVRATADDAALHLIDALLH